MKPPALTPHQSIAFEAIDNFFSRPSTYLDKSYVLSGYAGTGKTTLLSHLRLTRTKFCAPTGKAAQVLRRKGIDATTIHSLIYRPVESHGVITYVLRDELEDCSRIIVDESSMVSADLLRDLQSFNLPILFVGDPFQLAAVGEDSGLFKKYPSSTLSEVHRQALDNPIIRLATWLRENPSSHPSHWRGNDSSGRVTFANRRGVKIDANLIDQTIVGYNKTRFSVNARIRERLGLTGQFPVTDDRLIILRNNRDLGVVNGQQVLATEPFVPGIPDLDVIDPDTSRPYSLEIVPDVFTVPDYNPRSAPRHLTPVDYAYAITCHKSQGSEFPHVAVIDEPFGDPVNRWRYTAVTRASEKLTYFT